MRNRVKRRTGTYFVTFLNGFGYRNVNSRRLAELETSGQSLALIDKTRGY
jgi:hypothetical protein